MNEWDADVTKADFYGGLSYTLSMLSAVIAIQSVGLDWYVIGLLCMACTVVFVIFGRACWHDGYARKAFDLAGVE